LVTKKKIDRIQNTSLKGSCLNFYDVIYFKFELSLTFMEYKIKTGTLWLANGMSWTPGHKSSWS